MGQSMSEINHINLVQSSWKYMLEANNAEVIGLSLYKNMKLDVDTSQIGDQASKNEIEKNSFSRVIDTMGVVINGLRENEDCSK